MLGFLFTADLEVDIPPEKDKKLVFCDALTAGIRKKGRKRVESNDCCAPVTVRKKRQAWFWEKWPLMFWGKRNGSTGNSSNKVLSQDFLIFFPLFLGRLKLCQTWASWAGLSATQYLFLLTDHNATGGACCAHLSQEPGGQKGWHHPNFLLKRICDGVQCPIYWKRAWYYQENNLIGVKVIFSLSEVCPIFGHVMSGALLSCPYCSLQTGLYSPEPARSTSLSTFFYFVC